MNVWLPQDVKPSSERSKWRWIIPRKISKMLNSRKEQHEQSVTRLKKNQDCLVTCQASAQDKSKRPLKWSYITVECHCQNPGSDIISLSAISRFQKPCSVVTCLECMMNLWWPRKRQQPRHQKELHYLLKSNPTCYTNTSINKHSINRISLTRCSTKLTTLTKKRVHKKLYKQNKSRNKMSTENVSFAENQATAEVANVIKQMA